MAFNIKNIRKEIANETQGSLKRKQINLNKRIY